MRSKIKQAMINNTNPLQVRLVSMSIQDDEILEIIDVVENKSEVTMVDLDSNHIGDAGAIILSEKLIEFHSMRELSLQFNNIGKKGALQLFSLRKHFPHLDILFNGNQITDEGEMDQIACVALRSPK